MKLPLFVTLSFFSTSALNGMYPSHKIQDKETVNPVSLPSYSRLVPLRDEQKIEDFVKCYEKKFLDSGRTKENKYPVLSLSSLMDIEESLIQEAGIEEHQQQSAHQADQSQKLW